MTDNSLQQAYELAKAKREAIGEALEEARGAFEEIKELHERALLDEQAAMAALLTALAGKG